MKIYCKSNRKRSEDFSDLAKAIDFDLKGAALRETSNIEPNQLRIFIKEDSDPVFANYMSNREK